jgi:adenine-specific DNA-methyltransferase
MPTLNWIGKDKVINHAADVPYRVLEHKYTHGEDSGNMIIKGDNLAALKSLLPMYEGRVKCIYIDPPYNTGNEGWVYNDNVNDPKIKKWLGEVVGKEGDDLSRHDKWLCKIPRVLSAKPKCQSGSHTFESVRLRRQHIVKERENSGENTFYRGEKCGVQGGRFQDAKPS